MASNYIQLAVCKAKDSETVKVFEAPSFSVNNGDQVVSREGEIFTVIAQMNCTSDSDEAEFAMVLSGVDLLNGFDRLAGSVDDRQIIGKYLHAVLDVFGIKYFLCRFFGITFFL